MAKYNVGSDLNGIIDGSQLNNAARPRRWLNTHNVYTREGKRRLITIHVRRHLGVTVLACRHTKILHIQTLKSIPSVSHRVNTGRLEKIPQLPVAPSSSFSCNIFHCIKLCWLWPTVCATHPQRNKWQKKNDGKQINHVNLVNGN